MMVLLTKTKIFLALLQLIIMAVAVFKVIDYIGLCNYNHLHKVCHAYKNGTINGSMCAKLCSEDIVFRKCLSSNKDKGVFEMQLRNETFIIKFRNSMNLHETPYDEWKILSIFNGTNWCVDLYGNCGGVYVVEKVEELAGEIYGTADDFDDMLGLPEFFDHQQILSYNFSGKSTLISQLIEKAIMLKKELEDFMYAWLFRRYNPTFKDRILFIKNTLIMLKNMAISTGGKVLLCDAHLNNLGITKDKSVKLIDADHVLSVPEIVEKLSEKTCTSNNDCGIGDYNDCRSFCNISTHRCSTRIPVTNLSNFCNIFMSLVLSPLPPEQLNCIEPLCRLISDSFSEELNRIEILLRAIDNVTINCLK